jgi:acyl-CoA thioesterase
MSVEATKAFMMEMFNERASIARTFGMSLSYTGDGRAVITLPYNPALDHAQGAIHGGVYATMLDNAGWFTAVLAQDEPCWVATSELSMHLLEAARQTGLRAEGWLLKRGSRQHVAEMKLWDDAGRLVAQGTATFVVLHGVGFTPRNTP